MKKFLLLTLIVFLFKFTVSYNFLSNEYNSNFNTYVGKSKWSDWDGLQTCSPLEIVIINNEQEIIDQVKNAIERKQGVKVVGAGHSFSPIALTDDNNKDSVLLILDGHKGLKNVDKENLEVEVYSGTRLYEINELLEKEGLALENLGGTSAQSIAGAISTGTHGTGKLIGSISTQAVGLRIIDGTGNVLIAKRGEDGFENDLFLAARVGLGHLGIISTVTLKVLPLFKMKLTNFSLPVDTFFKSHDYYYEKYDRFLWSYTPHSDQIDIQIREVTDEDITPGGCWEPQGDVCVDISYKTLTDYPPRDAKHTPKYTEMEMFVAVEDIKEVAWEFLEYQKTIEHLYDPSQGSLFSGIRYIKHDDITLSPMFQRDSAVINFVVSGTIEKTGDFNTFQRYTKEGLERIAGNQKYKGVPHWGKRNWASKSDLLIRYPEENLNKFEEIRKKVDPYDIFLNDYYREKVIGEIIFDKE